MVSIPLVNISQYLSRTRTNELHFYSLVAMFIRFGSGVLEDNFVMDNFVENNFVMDNFDEDNFVVDSFEVEDGAHSGDDSIMGG